LTAPASSHDRLASRPDPVQVDVITEYLPGLDLLKNYQARWLAKDVIAGLVLSALLVPQGMAYAELAGLPAVTGLYTSVLCLAGYAIFGPSKILVHMKRLLVAPRGDSDSWTSGNG
jgi:hypothetical protein